MDNENFDLETELDQKPSAGNKDLWLFLIVIDIVFLCVFGFFLYKNLSARFFNASPADLKAATNAEETVEPAEETVVTETEIVETSPAVNESVPAAEPAEEVPSTVFPVPPQAKPEESKPQIPAAKSAEDKKESVLVKVNPKSKYRRVTFRYYGEGKKVAVVSGFTMAKPQALKKKNGYWETTLSIAPGSYKYLYVVDGVNTLDPYSEEKDGRSFVEIN